MALPTLYEIDHNAHIRMLEYLSVMFYISIFVTHITTS